MFGYKTMAVEGDPRRPLAELREAMAAREPPRRRRRGGVHHGAGSAALKAALGRSGERSFPRAPRAAVRRLDEAPFFRSPLRLRRSSRQVFARLQSRSVLTAALEFLGARDLVAVERTCVDVRLPDRDGYGPCDLAAKRRLDDLGREPSPGATLLRSLHLELTRCEVVVLRRRDDQGAPDLLDSIRGAAAIVQGAMALFPPTTTTHATTHATTTMTDDDQVSDDDDDEVSDDDGDDDVLRRGVRQLAALPRFTTTTEALPGDVVVRDGIFAAEAVFRDARSSADERTVLASAATARAIKLGHRSLDGVSALGECVLESAPKGLGVDADGTWILRRVDGEPCWAPETLEARLAKDDDDDDHHHPELPGGKKPVRLDFERAYERRSFKLPLAASAASAVAKAKELFRVHPAQDVALFATATSHADGKAACLTALDPTSLQEHGFTPANVRVLVLVVLPSYDNAGGTHLLEPTIPTTTTTASPTTYRGPHAGKHLGPP